MARILVVEDDALNQKLFSLILTRAGKHEVTIARDAEDAVKLGTSGDFDLIIMDISLQNWIYSGKEVNGIDLTRIIKATNNMQRTLVMLATAHAMKDDYENLMRESGAEGYFSKPINDHILFLEKIKSLIKANANTGAVKYE
jgi:two-component system, cell cycle response regulator DivK